MLRAEGIDRFDNPITGQSLVQVSDDKDRVRLRILADKHTFKVGDTAEVQLHWREEPALALVTFQGAKILDYKLIDAAKRREQARDSDGGQARPEFRFGSGRDDRRPARRRDPPQRGTAKAGRPFPHGEQPVHSRAQSESRIGHAAQRVTPKRPIRPGDEVELVVKTTDPQGQPVPAELSVAMIEPSLLAMFGWNVGPIDEAFRGNVREPAMRTNSSITFAYRPATRPIDRHLLAEEERTEIAAEEATRLHELETTAESFALDRGVDEAPPMMQPGAGVDGPGPGVMLAGEPTEGQRRLFAGGTIVQEEEDLDLLQDSISSANAQPMGGVGGGGFGAARFGRRSVGGQGVTNLAVGANGRQQDDFAVDANLQGNIQFRQGGFNQAQNQMGQLGLNGNNNTYTGATALGASGSDKALIHLKAGVRGDAMGRAMSGVEVNSDATVFKTEAALSAFDDQKAADVRFGNNASMPSGQNFNMYWNEGRKDLVVVLGNGEQGNVRLMVEKAGQFDNDAAGKQAAKLAAAGAVLVPQSGLQETGFWNPAVVTDGKGRSDADDHRA